MTMDVERSPRSILSWPSRPKTSGRSTCWRTSAAEDRHPPALPNPNPSSTPVRPVPLSYNTFTPSNPAQRRLKHTYWCMPVGARLTPTDQPPACRNSHPYCSSWEMDRFWALWTIPELSFHFSFVVWLYPAIPCKCLLGVWRGSRTLWSKAGC